MERNNLRPNSLKDVAESQSQNFGANKDLMKRAHSLLGMMSSGAQMNNTDNYKTIPIEKLVAFKEHPFQIRDDGELQELTESIKESGLAEAILVRPLEDGYYEILAGHRRVAACKKLGWQDINTKVLNVDDEEAIIIMVNTNFKRRQKLLHSEKAKAYKMQIQAYKCQGKRTDLVQEVQNEIEFGQNLPEVNTETINDFRQNLPKVNSRDLVAQINNITAREVSSYIRLNKLIETLLNLVDSENIPFYAGVALSFLTKEEQNMIVEAIEEGVIKKIDLKTAEELKVISKSGELNRTVLEQMFSKKDNIVRPQNTFSLFQSATKKALKHFKKVDYQDVQINSEELEQVIFQALKNYAETRKGE